MRINLGVIISAVLILIGLLADIIGIFAYIEDHTDSVKLDKPNSQNAEQLFCSTFPDMCSQGKIKPNLKQSQLKPSNKPEELAGIKIYCELLPNEGVCQVHNHK